ncbi:MAG: glycerophosphodiester phosphodiesterase [Candidatus Promineifilaceae bacterium]|nr:glycerophosphodiester phosphodiesterase [Candidatus Promineifilaceae bacterium]
MLAWVSRPVPEHAFFGGLEKPAVIAHQGGDGLWPSNTLFAFEQAAAMGVDVLEMDIHATADGAIVVSHDETVDRLTDGRGLIKEMTLEEVQALDAGYRWNKDPAASFPYRGMGLTIPTLEAVFDAFPNMPLNVEIKQREPSLVPSLCALIRRHNRQDAILIASFHPQVMDEFRRECPEVATSATESEIRPFFVLNRIYLDAVYRPPAEAFQVPEYSGDLHVVTGRFVRGAHRHNVDVHVWTVDETDAMQRLLGLGVDGIITDRPDRLMTVLGR